MSGARIVIREYAEEGKQIELDECPFCKESTLRVAYGAMGPRQCQKCGGGWMGPPAPVSEQPPTAQPRMTWNDFATRWNHEQPRPFCPRREPPEPDDDDGPPVQLQIAKGQEQNP